MLLDTYFIWIDLQTEIWRENSDVKWNENVLFIFQLCRPLYSYNCYEIVISHSEISWIQFERTHLDSDTNVELHWIGSISIYEQTHWTSWTSWSSNECAFIKITDSINTKGSKMSNDVANHKQLWHTVSA